MKQKRNIRITWWITYQKYVRKVVLSDSALGFKDISYWRNEIFLNIIIYFAPLSIVALIPGVYMSFLNGIPVVGVADLLAFASLIMIMTSPGILLRVRKLIFISVFYVLSVLIIYYVGKAGPGLLFLLSLTVISAVIYSAKAGYFTSWLNTLICIAFGGLTFFHAQVSLISDFSLATWITITSNLVLLSFGCAKCIDLLLIGLTTSLRDNRISEAKLEKANRLYQFISHINQSIVRVRNEQTLFFDSCETAVKIGKFEMAWIGKFDSSFKKIALIEQSGIPEAAIPLFNAAFENNGPQDLVLTTGQPYISNDIENTFELQSWKPFATLHGVRSCIIMPIKKEGCVIGTFNLYASEINFFDEMEIAPLDEAACDISFALDIFEKEKKHNIAENLLIKNENRFRSIIEKSADMKVLTNVKGEFTYGSPSVTKIFGYSRQEFLNKSALTFFHPDDQPDLIKNIGIIREVPGRTFSFQYRLSDKNRNWLWCEGTLTNMLHEPGVHSIVCNFRDITERKQSEQELISISASLRATLRDLQKIMDSSLDIICSMDENGKFVRVSNAAKHILGYQPDELVGKKYIDMVWHEDIEKTNQAAVKIMSGNPTAFFENRYLHKNGGVKDILWSARWDNDSRLMYCIAKDVSERKKIELQLNKSESFNLGMLDDLKIANQALIFQNNEKEKRASELALANKELAFESDEKENRAAELIIANKELIFQNNEKEKRAAELIIANKELAFQSNQKEKRAAELIIANKELLYQNEEKENRAAELIIANNELAFQSEEKGKRAAELAVAVEELAFQNKEKGKRAAELTIANKELIFQNNEKEKRAAELVIANLELAFQNKEKEKMSADLIQRSKNMEQFSYIVSHNLRGPVANILGISNVLKGKVTMAERSKIQKFLFTAVEQLDEIVKDLNKILQTRLAITENKEFVYFTDLVRNITSSIHNLMEKEDAKILTDFSSIDRIFTLKSYIHSIFYNLISNAIKYKQANKVPVLEIKSSTRNGKLTISFKDHGTGIDLKEHGESLFGLYKRFHMNIEGKGLGLFMVKTQVEILNGRISVKSKPARGTEFIIELPV